MAAKHNRMIKRAARKHHIPAKWLYGLWGAEHGLKENHFQRSSAGAQGPFQFMPATARSYGINPYKFGQAADAAAKYLATYKGRGLEGMYRAYNAGPAGGPNPQSAAHYQAALRYMKRWPGAEVKNGGNGAEGRSTPPSRGKLVTGKKVVVPGVDNSEARKALLMNYLEQRGKPGALLDVASQLPALRDVKERSITTRRRVGGKPGKVGTPGKGGGKEPGGQTVAAVKTLVERASHMDARHLPYVWGGGHQNPKATGPWDCSGAVSRLFRINPRVSGQFTSWGKPGKGKHVTVYANSGHVFVEINDRFFGTSRSNPGGGAGWIPSSQMSPSYLAQFTKRHPPGM